MDIAEYLIRNFVTKIKNYFSPNTGDNWKAKYTGSLSNIQHDEPWLTLIACYAIFGNQENMNNPAVLNAFNAVLKDCGNIQPPVLDKINEVQVEEMLPEIPSYRKFLKKIHTENNFHLYPDRRAEIEKKCHSENASFEGNTNLDLKIIGEQAGIKKTFFIEAKFLSDISYQIKYNPVRDQIIRNIDAGIDYMTNSGNIENITFKDFYFLLLTPQIFRPLELGFRNKSAIDAFIPERSRLYCYKMLEYKDYKNLKNALPHRTGLSDNQWNEIAGNIGWIIFEDFFIQASNLISFKSKEETKMIIEFIKQRNLFD